jgi:lysozyme
VAFADQLAAARADRDAKKAAYDTAEATYEALLTQSVLDGLDVSEFNGDVDWTQVASSAGFAFVRSADGDVNDKLYTAARAAALRTAGVPFGVYQFARVASAANNQRDGVTEAAMAWYFARRQGWGVKGDLPIVYDFENDSWKDQTAAKAAAHLVQAVRTLRLLQGRPAILYTNPATMAFVGPALDTAGKAELAQCPLWIAHFDVPAPTVPAPWTSWTFWQYTSKGACAGVTGAVDRDHFFGSKTDLAGLVL